METEKKPSKYHCETCDFNCCKKTNYEKHLLTIKHSRKQTGNKETEINAENTLHECSCGKTYKNRDGLWKHKKKCDTLYSTYENEQEDEVNSSSENDLVKFLLEENKSLKNLMLEQNTEFKNLILDVCKQIQPSNHSTIYNTTTTNSNNKTFNLQFFLNETCKDAMNIMEFVDSMKIELTDLENIAQVGYVKGMSNLILRNLKALDVTRRPVHCSDSKREVVYVKDNNEWHNDQKDGEVPNQKLKKAIKQITSKNMKLIPQWRDKYPDCVYAESRKSTLYNNMHYHTVDSSEEHSDKIIKNIAKEVVIDKQ